MTKIQINRIKQQGMNFGECHQQGHYIAYPIGISMIRLNYKRKLQKIRTREITIEVYPDRHKLRAMPTALRIPEREEASAVTLPQLPSMWAGDNRYTKDIIS